MFFIVFNITYNQLMLFVFKRGSSVLFVIANAVRLPLVDFLNSWGFVSGPAQESFETNDGYALFILVLAIIVYYAEKEEHLAEDGSVEDVRESLISSPGFAGSFRSRMSRRSSSLGSRPSFGRLTWS